MIIKTILISLSLLLFSCSSKMSAEDVALKYITDRYTNFSESYKYIDSSKIPKDVYLAQQNLDFLDLSQKEKRNFFKFNIKSIKYLNESKTEVSIIVEITRPKISEIVQTVFIQKASLNLKDKKQIGKLIKSELVKNNKFEKVTEALLLRKDIKGSFRIIP